MRTEIFDIIDPKTPNNTRIAELYDVFMMITIIVSLLPLFFKENDIPILNIIDKITVSIFIIDYAMRWLTADFKLKKGYLSFILYPFTFMAIIDLLSIIPSLTIVNSAFKTFRVLRLIRTFRVFKFIRYSKSIEIMTNVLKAEKDPLLAVGGFAVSYVIISALIIFNIEPDTFDSYFDALYWATISLTTVGYGDIFAVTASGRIFTMISALAGIAIVALPAGIITAGYMNEVSKSGTEYNRENTDN